MYFLPTPNGLETVEEADVFEEVGVEPQARGNGEDGDAEEDEAEDGHGEEEGDESHHANAQIPDPDAQLDGPEREHDDRHDDRQRTPGIQFLLEL